MTDAETLLPCPFCGGEAELLQFGNEYAKKRGFDINCKRCRITRKQRVRTCPLEWLKNKMISHWNTRAQVAAPSDTRQTVDVDDDILEGDLRAVDKALEHYKDYPIRLGMGDHLSEIISAAQAWRNKYE